MLEILFIPDELLLLFSWADIGTAEFGLKHEMPEVPCFLRGAPFAEGATL
jgi:hypothetical protein